MSLVINFSVLGFFKYFNFFTDSFMQLLPVLGLGHLPQVFVQIILPPASRSTPSRKSPTSSTCTTGKLKPASSLLDYALFISLFPHLIAGPIQRPSHLLPQVQQPRTWRSDKAFDGLLLILDGLFRKVVIADNCALIANAAFGGKFGAPSTLVVLLGTLRIRVADLRRLQRLQRHRPRQRAVAGLPLHGEFPPAVPGTSLQDFWRRWHISLSTWLRDYLYIPLGGNRHGSIRTYRNLMLTMLLGGLWHGANWTFVVWGGLHGLGLAVERRLWGRTEIADSANPMTCWARRAMVFSFVCLTWVFFRSGTVPEAFRLLRGLFSWNWQPIYGIAAQFLAMFVVLMLLLDLALERGRSE